MSEPFSDKAKSSMDIALHKPRPAMPFIEDVVIKTEIKAEPTGRESPLFEPQPSTKRSMDDEISVSEVKRSKVSTEHGPLAYNGNPVRQYTPGTFYKYSMHEALPEFEVNSKHHQDATANFLFYMENEVIPSISPFVDEDKSIDDTVKWLKKNAKIPVIPLTVFALLGNSGSGKTSTLNNLLGEAGIANADASLASVTQNPQLFNHLAGQSVKFTVEVWFSHGRSIEILIKKCLTDLVSYVRCMSDIEAEEEDDSIRESAESSRQVFDDLFADQNGLKSLDDVEEFLETRNLLPQGDESITASAVESVYQHIRERAVSDGYNLDAREVHFTAGNVGELRNRTALFSERGGYAPVVDSVRTQFYSPLLSMGIEIVDLPGYTDTNAHLRGASKKHSKNCSKVIFVADISRCLTTPELKKSLKEAIKRGAENVILVLRGKENVDTSTNKWTKDEIAHLETLLKSLKVAKYQLDAADEDAVAEATADVQKIESQIFQYRISVRDRVVIDHFSQKEFRNRHDNRKIRVITVGNKCHEFHMRGHSSKAVLPVHITGIKELRTLMCEAPSTDRVLAFARHVAKCITALRRISIWTDGPKTLPRDAAMALFEQYTRWSINEYKASLMKASTLYKKQLIAYITSTWKEAAQKAIDAWVALYAARTQGVFIRQGGRHTPNTKAMKTKSKKQRLVSWTEDLLVVVEDDVFDLLKSTSDAINKVEADIVESIHDVVKKLRQGLEMLDTIGGANLEGVFKFFEDERDLCIGDVQNSIVELKTNLRSAVTNCIADEPCDDDSPVFVKEMFKIFKAAFDKFPPKTKNLSKERIKYIKEQVSSTKGPYAMMCNEIFTQMVPVIDDWSSKTNARMDKLHRHLGDVLFKSFEGKTMPDARREQVAPGIKLVMEKAIAVFQADLDGYSANIL